MNCNIGYIHTSYHQKKILATNDDESLFFVVDYCKFSMKIVCKFLMRVACSFFLKVITFTITISSRQKLAKKLSCLSKARNICKLFKYFKLKY